MPMILLMAVVLASLTVAGISAVNSAPVVISSPGTAAVSAASWSEVVSGIFIGIVIAIVIGRLWRKVYALVIARNHSDRFRLF